jgi:hypothetical protein
MKSVNSFCRFFATGKNNYRTVTEADWLEAREPLLMLAILEPWAADEVITDRQLRLFACACSRRLWHLLTDERRKDVELAERFVDGEASQEAITARRREIDSAGSGRERPGEPAVARWCILDGTTGYGGPDDYRWEILKALREKRGAKEYAAQADLLRDIFGSPFSPVAFDPAWRTEHTVGIASKMYEERDFAAMPILADALEEAGCDNTDILAHCREPGVHVRGCWVVDLLLGKK